MPAVASGAPQACPSPPTFYCLLHSALDPSWLKLLFVHKQMPAVSPLVSFLYLHHTGMGAGRVVPAGQWEPSMVAMLQWGHTVSSNPAQRLATCTTHAPFCRIAAPCQGSQGLSCHQRLSTAAILVLAVRC